MTKRLVSLLLAICIILGVMSAGTVSVWAESALTTSDACLAMLKEEEGFSVKPYWDHTQYTVGYGTRCPDDMLDHYLQNGITEKEAEVLLRNSLSSVELDINKRIVEGYGLTLTQNQFDALVLFSYNCGTGWVYDNNGTLNKALKSGATGNDLIRAFALWCNAGGQVQETLLRRRLTEANMFLNGKYSVTPPDNYCYVLYNANGGTVSPRSQGYDSSTPVKPFSTPTYSGYTFVGWYTDPTGGTKVTKLNASVKNTMLYAHWVDASGNPPVTDQLFIEVTVTADGVNLRQGPGTNYAVVGTANTGDKLIITETASSDTLEWGKFEGGWICLQYTDFDTASRELTIKAQPTGKKASVGSNTKFTVAATGMGLKYQWQYRKTSSGSWQNSSAYGYKTATLTVNAKLTNYGYQYRCKITDKDGNVVYSNPAKLTVIPAITAQPVDKTVAPGKNTKFAVTATGSNLTYQWQYRKTASGSWQDSAAYGNKTATLVVAVQAKNDGYQYRCKVTDQYGNAVYSKAANLTATFIPITTQPTAKSVSVGSNAKFTVAATGNNLTYQWQFCKPSSESWQNSSHAGNKTATLSVAAKASNHGYQYRCKITDKDGNAVYTNAVKLTVIPAITTQPVAKTVSVGSNTKFTVTAKGDSLSYQWQYRKPSSESWQNSSAYGNKTAALTVNAKLTNYGYQYRCKITDSYGNIVYTDAVLLTVIPAITTQPANKTVSAGKNAKFTVAATGSGLTYQWQFRKPSSESWQNSGHTGNKTATLTVTTKASNNGYQYRCKIADSYGNVVYTNSATLKVK